MNANSISTNSMGEALDIYKRFAIKAANDLRYGKAVINKIIDAKTEGEVIRTMIQARLDNATK
jgi:hypothetical protein